MDEPKLCENLMGFVAIRKSTNNRSQRFGLAYYGRLKMQKTQNIIDYKLEKSRAKSFSEAEFIALRYGKLGEY